MTVRLRQFKRHWRGCCDRLGRVDWLKVRVLPTETRAAMGWFLFGGYPVPIEFVSAMGEIPPSCGYWYTRPAPWSHVLPVDSDVTGHLMLWDRERLAYYEWLARYHLWLRENPQPPEPRLEPPPSYFAVPFEQMCPLFAEAV